MSLKRFFVMYVLSVAMSSGNVLASDHDDGENDYKSRALNLTDLYAFREDSQSGETSQRGNLILIMNTNPRSLPRQQYSFSTNARYELHLSRVLNDDDVATGKDDILLRFEFENPDSKNRQVMKITTFRDGRKNRAARILTTSLADMMAGKTNSTAVNVEGKRIDVFAGLREDPFYFDVEQFFRLRAAAAGIGPVPTAFPFKTADKAIDFTHGYNVNSIVVRVPISFLQNKSSDTTFDVWSTVSIKRPGGEYMQIERLARPAINEGLVLSNKFLNAFNFISPSQDLSDAAAPVRKEAVGTMSAALAALNPNANAAAIISSIATAFLPDVMRINTSDATTAAVGSWAYNHAASAQKKILVGGRKLEDDVIDITLSAILGLNAGDGTPLNKPAVSDGVSYQGTVGNGAQGHKMLNAATAYGGKAAFPYLALPN